MPKSLTWKAYANRLLSLPRAVKVSLAIALDAASSISMGLLAAIVVFGLAQFPQYIGEVLALSMIGAVLTVVAIALQGAYRSVTRYLQGTVMWRVVAAATVVTVALGVISAVFFSGAFDWRACLVFALLNVAALNGWRILAARLLTGQDRSRIGTPVAVYGAGDAGRQLVAALRSGGQFRPVAFIDDDTAFWGHLVAGVRVHGPDSLDHLKTLGVERVLVALPSVNHGRRKQILEAVSNAGIAAMIMPGMDELATGAKQVDELREVQIEDLLSRDPVPPDPELLHLQVRGKTVLVTGAGGSIGSELCRQVHALGAEKLLLLDSCEYALYEIDRQLRCAEFIMHTGCKVVPILGNVCDERHLRAIFAEHAVDTVYHSAAYKHVPLVEANSIAAAHNNINGTERTARAALQAGVQNFVLVSTDKAVRPTSVMGATKRFCELVIQALGQEYPDRSLSMVRFGNVLGSSGSVVPLFREQIRNGGPITVTHPEVTRYFMTIPEAASLVIQAGSMGRNGEVFVLDMGEPVRIRDLAERMVRLCGLTSREDTEPPEKGDIAIRYTGLRPGEKLYEELLIGSDPEATSHSRIMKANERALDPDPLADAIEQMRQAIEWRNHHELASILASTVQGFERDMKPSLASASDHAARPVARQPA